MKLPWQKEKQTHGPVPLTAEEQRLERIKQENKQAEIVKSRKQTIADNTREQQYGPLPKTSEEVTK